SPVAGGLPPAARRLSEPTGVPSFHHSPAILVAVLEARALDEPLRVVELLPHELATGRVAGWLPDGVEIEPDPGADREQHRHQRPPRRRAGDASHRPLSRCPVHLAHLTRRRRTARCPRRRRRSVWLPSPC